MLGEVLREKYFFVRLQWASFVNCLSDRKRRKIRFEVNGQTNFCYGFNKAPKLGQSFIADGLKKFLWPLIAEKKFRLRVDREFNFTDVKKAHELMESREHMGKICLTINQTNGVRN